VNFVSQHIDTVQTVLNFAGMIPGLGAAFDAVNGLVYAARGDLVNAAMSFSSAIPVVGDVIGGARAVANVAKGVISATKTTEKIVDNVSNIVSDLPRLSGRLGGKEHREMVSMLEKAYSDAGYKVDIEHQIKTPGGLKPCRFADLFVYTSKKKGFAIQVGRETKAGNPVAREQAAMKDIQNTGTDVTFIPYSWWRP
jgi:hypothetical protein